MSVKESLYSQYDSYINGEKLARNAWLAEENLKYFSTAENKRTNDATWSGCWKQLQAVAKFFGKKLSRGFKINTKFAGVD